MDGTNDTTDWAEIERRLGLRNPADFARREIEPVFEALSDASDGGSKGDGSSFEMPVFLMMGGFIASFLLLGVILPDNFIGAFLRFILFIPLFFVWVFFGLYLCRHRIAEVFVKSRGHFAARSEALTKLATVLGLTYIPAPGGAPAALKMLAKYSIVPKPIRDAAVFLDDHGGMDAALATARQSGTMLSNVTVIASKESMEKYKANAVAHMKVEDGFQGDVDGVAFSAFEWVQPVEDDSDVFHLVIVFNLPNELHGITQLRSRHISWPGTMSTKVDFNSVGVVAPAFEDRFRMRTTDQVEARTIFDPAVLERVTEIAHGEKVRAVAFDQHLVVDVEGEDRFAMLDLLTGEWDRDRIAKAMLNIAEMKELAEAVANAFRLK